jgi:hypothetical protein
VPELALNLLIRPQRPVPARVRKIVDTLKAFMAEAFERCEKAEV